MESSHNSTPKISSDRIWHRRLGHSVGLGVIRKQLKSGILPKPEIRNAPCEDCASGKFRKRFGGSLTDAPDIGKLHADVKGKIETTSVSGYKYFLTIVEEYTRYTVAIPIRSKGAASEALQKFTVWFERQTGYTTRKFHTDGGK